MHSSDYPLCNDDGEDVVVTRHDNKKNGGNVIVPHGTVILSIDDTKTKKKEFDDV